jgi:uncharacterized membrane protein YgcG
MKKIISVLFAICVAVALTVSTFAAVSYTAVYDNAGFFTDSEYSKIIDKAEEISEDTGWCIMIVTEAGRYTESEARSELKTWYGDDFGSSQKGAAFIMTSETGDGEGNNDYALVIETFGGASINKTQTYDRAESEFLDYDEYGAADVFLSACANPTSGSSSGGSTNPLVIIIVVVLIVGAFVISAIKRKILGSVGLGGNNRYRNGYQSRRRYDKRSYGSSRRGGGGGSGGSSGGSSGRSGKR